MTPFVDTKECEEVSDEYVNEEIANLYEGDNGALLMFLLQLLTVTATEKVMPMLTSIC